MNKEPSFLTHLGEFATLKNAIGSWYHQDAYLDFGTDEEIWSDIFTGHDKEAMSRIQAQLSELLERSDENILLFWNSEAHSHNFINGTEARAFLEAMLSFFRATNATA
ncbi:contact-dependent growth inhibition system immunity protein [Pseudomonas sp. JZ134]|uniref:contact-dependent growth inhibition system immunity protein n=1 Tax=Pseudomonas sp. JZ134 TaxID=2806615 RepID=UPI003D9FC4DB